MTLTVDSILWVYCSNFPQGFSTSMVSGTWSIITFLSTDSVDVVTVRVLQNVITSLDNRVPEFNLAPQSSTFPSSTTHLSPSTDNPLTTQFRWTTAPGPTMEFRTIVPSPTCAPSKTILPSIIAPSPTIHLSPKEVRPPIVAPAPISHVLAMDTGGSRLTSLERLTDWSTL